MIVGDLVKMKQGYSTVGYVLGFPVQESIHKGWLFVMWPDVGRSLEKIRDLEVISELSDEQLELVRGGMSSKTFSHWRAEVLNEDW